MSGLSQSTGVPCRGGEPALAPEAWPELLAEVPAWGVATVDGVPRLRREFRFADFRGALAFAVQVGLLAERLDHHPDLHVAWGRVGVETWTHKIGGLHRNDFVLAAHVDRLGTG